MVVSTLRCQGKPSSANPEMMGCVFSADVHEAGDTRAHAGSKRVIQMQFMMLGTQLLYETAFALAV